MVKSKHSRSTQSSSLVISSSVMSASEAPVESSSNRLLQLSEEVDRIATVLARLSAGPAASSSTQEGREANYGQTVEIPIESVRDLIRARRVRARYFSDELFADPAWDMLLDLFRAEIAQQQVSVLSLCIAAAVPATTALRWIKTMTDADLFHRRADSHDHRRVFVELSRAGSNIMRNYFSELSQA